MNKQIDTHAIGCTIPNVDGLPIDCVRAVQQEAYELARHFEILANYAECKAKAMQCRLDGKINLALELESACDDLFNKLPKSFRW